MSIDPSFEILFYVKNHKYSLLGRSEPFDALQTRRRLLNEMSVIIYHFIDDLLSLSNDILGVNLSKPICGCLRIIMESMLSDRQLNIRSIALLKREWRHLVLIIWSALL